MYRVTAACGCNIGKVRRNNEDNFYFDGCFLPQENTGLEIIKGYQGKLGQPICFGVFDGMGGEACGEEAAYLAAKTMWEVNQAAVSLPEALLHVCMEANQRICQVSQKHGIGVMGSTAVLLGLWGEIAYIANIGDSRALLYRKGVLQQISKDHTDQFLLDLQGIKNRKPRLTQHLGIEPEEMVIEPYLTEVVIQPGDLFLLCTDGLTDMIAVDEITHMLQKNIDVMETVAALINRAMDYGGRDNVTVMLCRVEQE